MWRLQDTLRDSGIEAETFGYVAAFESIEAIVNRLTARLAGLAGGDYVVIGHSLGGLLLRAAIAALPSGTRRPRRLIMLATPNHSPRLARRFRDTFWYRVLNGEAGRLLADEARLLGWPRAGVPSTVIAGTHGIGGRWSPFGADPNDGIVAVTETQLDGVEEWLTFPVAHPFMMNARAVQQVVLERCR